MTLLSVFFVFSNFVYADEGIAVSQADPDHSGYYYETIIEEEPMGLSFMQKVPSSMTTKKKSKTIYYKNSSGKVM